MNDTATFSLVSAAYPPAKRGRVIVWGMLGSYPFGGMTWQALQYIAGLRRLGYDVWYVEDSDSGVLDPVNLWRTWEYSDNLQYLSAWMERLDLGSRWIFRPPGQPELCLGARDWTGLKALYQDADAAFNLCGYHAMRPHHDPIRRRVYLQTDPMAVQVKVAQKDDRVIAQLDAYDYLFTYGENLGAPDCLVPITRYDWHPTRPPVCLDWWKTDDLPNLEACFTTVSNWTHRDDPLVWEGERYYYRKDREFRRFLRLPLLSSLGLELALDGIADQEIEELEEHGWHVVQARNLSEPFAYRDYIRNSLGEFSVTKDQYVRPRTGWFSDRSVCYLAAGRPVIAQQTGFSGLIPTGKGLYAFEDLDDILAAIEAIRIDLDGNCRAAREIAAEYFCAEKVIGSLMERVGL
jgi:hypothetical protein